MVTLICSFPVAFMQLLETHYAKYRHTEAAIGLHNLSDDTLRTGSVRYRGKNPDNIWHIILTVTPDAVYGNVAVCASLVCSSV